MVRQHTGKEVAVSFAGNGVSSSWTSVSIDIDNKRWLLRCYCHSDIDHTPLEIGKGNLEVSNNGQWASYSANLTNIGKPYTFDDAIVYEYTGVLEAENGE